jgi:hypothetical protein
MSLPYLSFAGEEDLINIKSIRDIIEIKKTGAAEITEEIQMEDFNNKDLYLPMNYIWIDMKSAVIKETGESLTGSIKTLEGIDYIYLNLDGKDIREKTIKINFKDPAFLIWKNAGPGDFGIYTYKTEYRNSTRMFIEDYEMELVLPEGFIINSIIKSTPAFTSKDPEPPYSYKNLSNKSHIYIKTKNLSPFKVCSIEYSFVEKKNSYVLPVASIIIMVLFLVFFRDMVNKQ